MTPEEAKARVAAQDAELAGLEGDVARLATAHSGPVLMVRGRVETVAPRKATSSRVHNKIRFYRDVLGMLKAKGIA